MALAEKSIALSDFEQAAQQGNTGMGWVLKLPLFVLRAVVLRNIDSYRYPKDIPMPIMPDSAHKIAYTRCEIDGRPNPVGISIYRRKEDEGKKLPLLLFIHGGGFLGGDSRMSEGLMRHLVDKVGVLAASVDYNVAPEVKHPVPLQDCHRALQYVLDNYAVDTGNIFLAGDSAGGQLAAALTLKLQDEDGPVPRGQILIYPVTDLDKIDSESYREPGMEYGSMRKGIQLSRSLFLPDRASRKHPYVTPLYAKMSRPQPDALLLIAERDGLRDDGIKYAEKLEQAGGYVRCVLYKGAFHSFINDLFRSDIADDAAAEMAAFLQARIDTKNKAGKME